MDLPAEPAEIAEPAEGEEPVVAKRQGAEQAIQLALESKWEEAVTLNRSLIAQHGRDISAWNRLGKALLELGRFREAREAYGESLEIDALNAIARRNLDRLSTLGEAEPARRSDAVAKIAQDLFIEETGKSGATILAGTSPELLATMTAGDEVYLKPSPEALRVENVRAELLGTVEPKLGLRLSRLMEGGNRYAAAVKSVSEQEAELVIKETYRDPSQKRLSFPAVRGEGARTNVRDSLLRLGVDHDEELLEDTEAAEDWDDDDKEAGETTVSLSSVQRKIERDEDDEDDDDDA